MTILLLLALFIIRLLMMLLITDSGTTGGIFIPTLAIGAVYYDKEEILNLLRGLAGTEHEITVK